MHYEGMIIRPPSEANAILLQVAAGCSHKKCTFCGTYAGERFKIIDEKTVMADIAFAAANCRRQDRLFLVGGDALILPQKRLLKIFREIQRQLPWVKRVGIYANTKALNMKTPEELAELRSMGLGIAYMGLESGDDETLQAVCKGATAEKMIAMGRKARTAGIHLSVTVLLGLAGTIRSKIHAVQTGRVLSAIDPEYVGALSLMLIPGTPLYEDFDAGRFTLPDAHDMLRELRTMIAHTDLSGGLFHANHASNYLPIRARLPEEKEATLERIDAALDGRVSLKPEYMRAL
jgi:radical SAM superfamily enzyme YgiQ (UPF0313 family)